MNTYALLNQTIEHLQAQGKIVTITKLPSNTKYRKSTWIKK